MTGRKKWKIVFALFLVLAAIVGIYTGINNRRKNAVASMNSLQMIGEYTGNNKNLLMTVGVIYEGERHIIIFAENGRVPDSEIYTYEIGSITKTFTISLLCKALNEGKISLDEPIAEYLPLNKKSYFPTIGQLATHTAGYGNYPLSLYFREIVFLISGKDNPFLGYSNEKLLADVSRKKLSDKKYGWNYSNFGISVVGYVLGQIYGKGYKPAMENFISQDLGLNNTTFDGDSGDFDTWWVWNSDDAYLSAGGLKSNIQDMLRYAEIQMGNDFPYLGISKSTDNGIVVNDHYRSGLAWIIDRTNNVIWHNGGTSSFNSFIGFDSETAVIVLSNVQDQPFINATSIGMKIIGELQEKNTTILR
jgi:CubicO group peptidase (beta-lactamase class C family)